MWIGTKPGVIFTYDAVSHQFINRISFHADDVRAACTASGRFVFTAAGTLDSRVAVWRWPGNQQKKTGSLKHLTTTAVFKQSTTGSFKR